MEWVFLCIDTKILVFSIFASLDGNALNNFNIISVLLLGAQVAAAAGAISLSYEHKAWLMLSWVSTVAGNLSLLGSAANLMACEQARRAPHLTYNLSFWKHLKFGVPSTLIVTAIGLTLIHSSSSTYVPAKTLISVDNF